MTQPTDAHPSPLAFLRAMLGANLPDEPDLRAYESRCRRASLADVAAGRPPDADAARLGCAAGVIWRGFVQENALAPSLLLYIAAFHDPRLTGVFAPTLAVTQVVDKYAPEPPRAHLLAHLKARDGSTPRGEVWLVGDATASVTEHGWRLTGRVGPARVAADFAAAAARVEGDPALFLVPRLRADGNPNFSATAGGIVLRSGEAWLLAEPGDGPVLSEEIDGLMLAAECMGALALAQRALDEGDVAGGPWADLREAFALAWYAVELLNATWRELPAYPSEVAGLFRLIVRLARLRAAALALDAARASGRADMMAAVATFDPPGSGRSAAFHTARALQALRDAATRRRLVDALAPFADVREQTDTLASLPPAGDSVALVTAMSRVTALARVAGAALARRLDAARALAGESFSL